MNPDRVPPKHYKWGQNCDGWHLVDSPEISVIHEKMPSGTSAERHFHNKATQLFYVISGEAVLEIEGKRIVLGSNESVEVTPGMKHCIFNESSIDLEFVVVSRPSAQGDRVDA